MKVKYLLLELLFIVLIINNYGLFVDMDKADLVCLDVGINNYLEFGWNNYFHWFRDDLDNVCRFETKNLFIYFWFVFTYYTIFKIITVQIFPVGCKLHFLIPEMIVFMLSFGLRIILDNQFEITEGSIKNAALGILYMFSPLILYMFFVYLICQLIIKNQDHIKIFKIQNVSHGILLFLSSVLIFPPLLTVLYCILLVPFVCWLIYVKLTKVFVSIFSANKTFQNKYKSLKLILSIALGAGCIIGEVFFFRISYRQLSGLGFFTYYILFSAVIRSIYYSIMILIWTPKSRKQPVNNS